MLEKCHKKHYVILLYAPFVPEMIWNDVMNTLRYTNTSKDVDRKPCNLGYLKLIR